MEAPDGTAAVRARSAAHRFRAPVRCGVVRQRACRRAIRSARSLPAEQNRLRPLGPGCLLSGADLLSAPPVRALGGTPERAFPAYGTIGGIAFRRKHSYCTRLRPNPHRMGSSGGEDFSTRELGATERSAAPSAKQQLEPRAGPRFAHCFSLFGNARHEAPPGPALFTGEIGRLRLYGRDNQRGSGPRVSGQSAEAAQPGAAQLSAI